MGRSVTLVIPGDVYKAFSPNRSVSGWEKRRRVTAWRQRAWGAWYHAGSVQLDPPVRLQIVVHRARSVDSDNLQSACKAVRDSLTPMGWGVMQQACLPDDSPRTIPEVTVTGDYSPEWRGKEWVSVRVEEIEKEPGEEPPG